MQSNNSRDCDDALLLRARRMAQRTRASAACLRCKANKVRCSDYRPCAQCREVGAASTCTDLQSARRSSSASADETCQPLSTTPTLPINASSQFAFASFDTSDTVQCREHDGINRSAWSQGIGLGGGGGASHVLGLEAACLGERAEHRTWAEHRIWSDGWRGPYQDEQVCRERLMHCSSL